MEIKHVPVYSRMLFLRILWRVDLRGLYAKVHQTVTLVYSNHLCLTSFFSELQYSPASGRESRKFAGGVSKYAIVTFWPTL